MSVLIHRHLKPRSSAARACTPFAASQPKGLPAALAATMCAADIDRYRRFVE